MALYNVVGLKEKIRGCLCCQGVDLGIGKDCICKYITIIINNEKKHEVTILFLRLCACNEDRRVMGWLCIEFEN